MNAEIQAKYTIRHFNAIQCFTCFGLSEHHQALFYKYLKTSTLAACKFFVSEIRLIYDYLLE